MIDQAKTNLGLPRDNTLLVQQVQQLKAQMEKEKQEAVNAVRIEAQMQLSRALIEERAQKDIAVQQALAQARAEMSDKHTTVTAEPITVITDAGDKDIQKLSI